MTRRGIIFGIVIAVSSPVIFFLLFREGGTLRCWIEPCYENKPASYWINALSDKNPQVVAKAESALYEIGPPSPEAARLLLAKVKADPDPNSLRPTASGDPSPETAAITLRPILRALGPDAKEFIPALTELLQDSGTFHRLRACTLLGEMGSNAKEARPALTKALSDDFSLVRGAAAKAIKQIDSNK